MTITQPTTTGVEAETVEPVEPELCWLNLTDLAPHPDNPRTKLGDLGELTRSIRTSGVLESLLVLPADADGQYLIVAGHRRHAAAIKPATSPTSPPWSGP
jgi:ParB family chromosome partitioning protein